MDLLWIHLILIKRIVKVTPKDFEIKRRGREERGEVFHGLKFPFFGMMERLKIINSALKNKV